MNIREITEAMKSVPEPFSSYLFLVLCASSTLVALILSMHVYYGITRTLKRLGIRLALGISRIRIPRLFSAKKQIPFTSTTQSCTELLTPSDLSEHFSHAQPLSEQNKPSPSKKHALRGNDGRFVKRG